MTIPRIFIFKRNERVVYLLNNSSCRKAAKQAKPMDGPSSKANAATTGSMTEQLPDNDNNRRRFLRGYRTMSVLDVLIRRPIYSSY